MEDNESQDGRVLRAKALREGRRAQIMAAARTVFAEKGYEQGSIADIVETAGIARGTFYVHFESKRAVFGEILDELLRKLNEVIIRVDVESDVSPQDQLIGIVVQVLDILIENEDITRILLRNVGTGDAEFRQRLNEFYDHILALTKESLHTGLELGMVRDVDLDVTACCVIGGVKEAIDQLVLRHASVATGLDRRALAEKLLDYNLRGILIQ